MPAAQNKLTLGMQVQGLTYMGGNPKDQNNWLDLDKMAGSGLSGQDFLDQIQQTHPSLVPSIKAMAEGRDQLPANRVKVDPYWGSVFKMAQIYDPTLDQTTYPKRQQTAKAFAPGGEAALNLRNLNQGIGHLQDLADNINKVAGQSGLFGLAHTFNWAKNAFEQGEGDPGITSYEVPRTALSNELASIFKGKGSSSETEVKKFYDMLSMNNSIPQKQAAVRGLVNLLNSRLDELGQQYSDGMSVQKNGIDLLNPKAKASMLQLGQLGAPSDQASPAATPYDDQTAAMLKRYNVPTGN